MCQLFRVLVAGVFWAMLFQAAKEGLQKGRLSGRRNTTTTTPYQGYGNLGAEGAPAYFALTEHRLAKICRRLEPKKFACDVSVVEHGLCVDMATEVVVEGLCSDELSSRRCFTCKKGGESEVMVEESWATAFKTSSTRTDAAFPAAKDPLEKSPPLEEMLEKSLPMEEVVETSLARPADKAKHSAKGVEALESFGGRLVEEVESVTLSAQAIWPSSTGLAATASITTAKRKDLTLVEKDFAYQQAPMAPSVMASANHQANSAPQPTVEVNVTVRSGSTPLSVLMWIGIGVVGVCAILLSLYVASKVKSGCEACGRALSSAYVWVAGACACLALCGCSGAAEAGELLDGCRCACCGTRDDVTDDEEAAVELEEIFGSEEPADKSHPMTLRSAKRV